MTKKRIAYYCRVSTDTQEYLLQKETLDSVLKNRNDVELINIYAEKISGYSKEGERPEMNNLLNDVKNNLIDEVWGYDVSRISRDSINLQIICRTCTEYNVNVYFHVQNLNTLNPDGSANPITKMLIGLLGEFAEQDGKNFISKGRAGKLTKTRAGNFVGTLLPFGYTYINDLENKTKKIVIDYKQKKVIDYIFNAFVHERKALNKIANELNVLKTIDSDFVTKKQSDTKDYIHDKATVRRILTCTWYALGERTWSGELIKLDESLKFISMSDYEIANQLLKENIAKVKPNRYHYILNELLYCSCGEKMYPSPMKKLQISGYRCTSKRNKRVVCDDNKSINIQQSENAVWNLIKNKISDFKLEVSKKNNKEEEIKEKIEHNNQLIQSIKNNSIVSLNESRKRTINTYNKFGGDDAEFEQSIKNIDNQIKTQEQTINQLLSDNTKLKFEIADLDVVSEIEKNIKEIEGDKNLIKMYIGKLVKKITVAGGLARDWKTLLIIEWNENINNNQTTYLFYKFHAKKQMYYFINSIDKVSSINWDNQTKSFNVTDNYTKKVYNHSVDYFIEQFDKMYTNEVAMIDKIDPDVSLSFFSKEHRVFTIIESGQSELKIVTPFN